MDDDRDHAGRGALLQPVEQQVREQERREVVEGEGALEPVGGEVPGVPVPPDVVDQHVDPRQALEHLVGQPAHLGLRRQVRDEHVHLPPPAARISRAAPSVRSRSRPVIATCAPIAARPSAVALPMPPVPPVTRTVLPAIGNPGDSGNAGPAFVVTVAFMALLPVDRSGAVTHRGLESTAKTRRLEQRAPANDPTFVSYIKTVHPSLLEPTARRCAWMTFTQEFVQRRCRSSALGESLTASGRPDDRDRILGRGAQR